MAKKETNQMQSNELEIKAIAKAVGASLTRSGHKVPHSNLLQALSAALNKRNWQTLKTALQSQVPNSGATPRPGLPDSYDNKARFLVRLAYLNGTPLKALPGDCAAAMEQARANLGATLSGLLHWSGWHLPVDLVLKDSTVDAGTFKPDVDATIGRMHLNFSRGSVEFEVAYAKGSGWYLTAHGAAEFYALAETLVSEEMILGALDGSTSKELAGPSVTAKFWTDDRAFEATFDAQAYLLQAPNEQLEAIIDVGYRGDECTDDIAEYFMETNPDIKKGFEYLDVMLKRRIKHEDIGFECSVDREQFLRWMDVHRKPLLAKILCERHDVYLVQAEEEEIRGRWDWLFDETHRASDMSLETREEAEIDAYDMLGLLEREIDTLT